MPADYHLPMHSHRLRIDPRAHLIERRIDPDHQMIDPALPFIDLHRHLDGNVRLTTILDLGRRFNLPLPAWDEEGLRPHVQIVERVPSLVAFLTKFRWMTGVLCDLDACRRVAYENVLDGAGEGLHYLELRFSPVFMARPHNLAPEGVVEAVCDGVRAGMRDCGLPVKLIGILSRTFGPETAWRELDALLGQRDALVAVDLAGDEAGWPGDLFTGHFRRARDAGLSVTVHAGEAAGAASVWQALRGLGATRIGHGVRAVDDPVLMAYMADHGIGLEASLTSNLHTSTIHDYASHPLATFLEHGILATLNTDDPGISAIDLRYEFEVAAPAAGLSRAQIRVAQANALRVAFLTDAERTMVMSRVGRDVAYPS